ncbi:hypothetical protein QEZ54_23680 [Catellatospora sp. KI3]|uniref:hypothetical protein n=1 Tax=Catellatospora sp. KI3 TaxID=3041620 RepID=UPI002482CB21|nr:hypothetical protein [Catellatospora sp. KI3]MDI1463991.1 hypothetical protein [Catellatospora sp. KI3]
MRELSPVDLDRLIQSNRRLKLAALIVIVIILGLAAALVAAGLDFRVGPLLGVGIGALLIIPHRRLLTELGLSQAEAKEILAAERKRRRAANRSR